MASNMYPSNMQYPQPLPNRRYQIREKIFSLGDNFSIKDEVGQKVFTVRSKLFSFGDKLVLEDMAGNGLMKIRQELLHLHPTFHILSARQEDSDRQLATVKKKFTLLSQKFKIESVYGEYSIEGDIFAYSFILRKNGNVIATVSKQFFAFSDTYGVEISGTEDHAFILALIIVIDQTIHDKKD